MVSTDQPVKAPSAVAPAISPAASNDDLPAPDGAVSTTMPLPIACRTRSTRRSSSAVRPKKNSRSGTPKGRSPRYGAGCCVRSTATTDSGSHMLSGTFTSSAVSSSRKFSRSAGVGIWLPFNQP